jgi:hypothetical protein
MIHIERARLPSGTRAFAYHEDGVIVVQVSTELGPRERLGAIRQALRAAPSAGWRSLGSPVLLPALAGSLGLRRAPESPWPHRVLVTAVIVAVVAIGVATITTVSLHGAGKPPAAALQAGRPPLLSGPGPGSGQPTTGGSPGSRQPGNQAGSPAGQRGSVQKSGKKTATTSAGGPAPRKSGSAAPSPTTSSSPRPSQTSPGSPSPSPSPSPAKHSGGSGDCVGLLVVKICV